MAIDAAAPSVEAKDLATQLANVRRLSKSVLPHQSKPANLLLAVEETLATTLAGSSSSSTATGYSATAYFASLVSCLSKACTTTPVDLTEGALAPAALYILAIVAPETPRQVIAQQCNSLLPVLVPLIEPSLTHPIALRSIVSILTSVLLGCTCTPNLLSSSPLLKRAWNSLLELNIDPRPKVRHLAQESVRRVVSTPIPPKIIAGDHPYLSRAEEWVKSILKDEIKGGASQNSSKRVKFAEKGKGNVLGGDEAEGKKAIWVVQGLRGWVNVWSDEELAELCPLLLSLPPLPHLTPQIYSLLSLLLSPAPPMPGAPIDTTPRDLPNLPTILNALLTSPPSHGSPPDQIEYISALSSGLSKLSRQDSALAAREFFSKAWTVLWNQILLFPQTAPTARKAASEALGSQGLVRYCISEEMIAQALEYRVKSGDDMDVDAKRQKMRPPILSKVLSQLEKAMNTQPLMLGYLLPVLTAMISRLRTRAIAPAGTGPSSKNGSPAETLLLRLVVSVADLRTRPGFEDKDKVDEVVGMAFEVMGAEAVLGALLLNIEPDASGKPPQPGRAHLLPLMRSRITNDSLTYFVNNLVPLSERLFERKVKADEEGRGGEAKVWEAVIGQIWDCLPGFLDLARDLREGFTAQFGTLVTQLLYTQALLRSSVLRGLSTIVTSVQTLAKSSAPQEELLASFGVDQQDAAQSLSYLQSLATEMLAVLFNVFSSVPREQRGMVGDVISLWLGIMNPEELSSTYTKIAGHLTSALSTPATPTTPPTPPVSHTMLDLLIILIPHLPRVPSEQLFTAAATGNLIENSDAAIQKKSYRILTRLLESGKATGLKEADFDAFVQKISDASEKTGAGAQRDRMLLLAALVPRLPSSRLHLVPALVTEAVLGTKEVNEKARNAAFDLLVIMAKKMSEGGIISRKLLLAGDQEMDAEDVDLESGEVAADQQDTAATVDEYVTIVAAGLAAASPHMISASITALSRLLFEFMDVLSPSIINDLITTVVVFLGSKNREIVKSALGFAKVAVVSLPADTVTQHLPQMVPALLGWVHDHKNHFKDKTVHVFERMIRKYGYDAVYRFGGEGDEKKVLENIKKKKDRAKRQKAAREQAGSAGEGDDRTVKSSGNAFEDALYGSASESDGEGDVIAPAKHTEAREVKGRKALKRQEAFIREEDDEPMDLLDRSIAGRITKLDPASRKRKQPGQEAADFETDKETGRMVIVESDSEGDGDGAVEPTAAMRAEGSGYQTALTSVDGMTFAGGKLKLNKNTKRGRALEMDNDQDMLADVMPQEPKKRKVQKAEKLGDEFRAKRAGGDIRRGNSDPYAYVPLNKAGKHRGGSAKLNISGKKRGSRQA